MLHKPESEKLKQSEKPKTYAIVGRYVVRMAVDVPCPHCGRELVASDWNHDCSEGRALICAGCGLTVVSVSSS